MDNSALPIEIGFQKAKDEILQSINSIGMKYNLPSSITLVVVEQIVQDTKINTYESIIGRYDISLPSGVSEDSKIDKRKNIEKSDKNVSIVKSKEVNT